MFTGIISDIGKIRCIDPVDNHRIEFTTSYNTAKINLGASIACSGVCLTIVKKGSAWFAVNVSEETLSKTTINFWTIGTNVNFEQALRIGDELGGHILSGHVDGFGKVVKKEKGPNSTRVSFKIPKDLKSLIAKKGSIAVDGVSLTVNSISDEIFSVNIIPYTLENTTLGNLKTNDRVNVEVDMLARYVARTLDGSNQSD